jgi:1-acyl-sn-glycerol-3-phosphate acyltransferase
MGLGAYLTERISKNEVEIGLVPISALGMSLFLVFLCSVGLWAEGSLHEGAELLSLSAFFDRTWSIPAVLSLLGMETFGGGYIVPQMSYLQVKARPSELSQTIAGNNIWNALFMVTAAVVVMLLTKTIGISKSFAVLAVLNGTISLWLYFLYSERTLRLWMIFLSKVFYRVEVTGLENFPKEGAVILVSNHVSFVDWVILMGLIPRPIHFVIDYNYYYLPTGPFWFKQAGLVPIATRRESEEVLTSAFKAISRDLDEGSVIGVFPEGAITRDGKMRRFQPGVQKIVKNRSVPIVLASMDGLWGSIFSFKGGRVLFKRPESFRKRIKVTLSHPIESEIYDPIEAKAWVESQLETLE